MSRKAILLIMDGWGIGAIPAADAIANARTPFVSSLYGKYAHSQLIACGEDVGLPDGQMGNSEVGHLNLGAGRVVYQELQRINVAIRNGELAHNPVLQTAFTTAITSGKKLHFMGLVSDGGVHSHTSHLEALLKAAQATGVKDMAVHAFTDGRDTDPKSGLGFLQALQPTLKETGAQLATIVGRYWAMDRDNRWDRIHTAYEALVHGIGAFTDAPLAVVEQRYAAGETDEFLKPIIVTDEAHKPLALIEDGDVVICFNFRTDRCREITQVLTQRGIPEYGMKPLSLHYVTMTEYDKSFVGVGVVFQSDNLNNTLGEVLQNAGKKQIRIAETEKYPHVTFFFSGGREMPFDEENRILIPSPKDVPTYDLKPEMSALEITDAILPEIEKESADFICLNFANADMVGHTGVWGAAIRAAETVDACVARIVPLALAHGYEVFLTADHGNSDFMVNPDGSPNTAHSLNPVPFFLISNEEIPEIKDGKLGDMAPTILARMGVAIPAEMTGKVLV